MSNECPMCDKHTYFSKSELSKIIKIPEGTQSGKQFRLKGKGMPYMRGSGNGDLYVQVNTEVPISLNKEQKELLEKFRKIENEKSNPSIKQFFQKAKSFWKN